MQTRNTGMIGWRGLLVAALYVSLFGCATAPTPAPVTPPTSAAAPPAAEMPAVELGTLPAQELPRAQPLLPPLAEGAEHHIALILPLRSAVFGRAAEAVERGFLEAAALQPGDLPVHIYTANDEAFEAAALYRQAVSSGALAVAGPLTREGVAALAAEEKLPLPTLALNLLDTPREDALYFFGLPPESEVLQLAQWAAASGMLTATVVRTDTAYSRRLAEAFSAVWQQGGGSLMPEIVYQGDPSEIRTLSGQPGEMVFLAAEADRARLMRPYIYTDIPVYATSQVFVGNQYRLRNFDLANVHFVDMPWVLQADHPAVMVYPRAEPPLPLEMERLYALGVDAYRLLQVLYRHETLNALPLDGVTGKLTLDGHRVRREAMKAEMRDGQGVALEGGRLSANPAD
ncbi:MAG: penicillin-binding protein activator [Gallionella sp.]|nr:penicillin-binding protein activator [Gallionella sp.]PIR09575.1 MAG: penicillin-binding protein activator [Gallionellaceae bacterium CG11_big_fil_rev_8_21_14_0_20_60_62]PIV47449.1 MAG: penicillin-binding protein activator [Gallionellaceae bacterium CG02_land_8_20_14_3_00_60_115]PIY05474.1 MAG: penicillin-binding protein activator [Gallionellaceae bacterium CG_4_10_14_3_um_filter_60_1069]PJC05239.1 MAG: penicillin-binding protein activator [Gallionellaceae bacterium CG_4_9_14_0_8_um_filter_6